MNDLLNQLAQQLKGGGSKAVALLVAGAIVLVIGVAGVWSNRPHLEPVFRGLSDHEVASVSSALAESGIPFEVSSPPGPFVVYVDGGDRSAAYASAYGSGALDRPIKGIIAPSGASSIFQGTEERLQGVRKREWEEMEGMLEALDFVVAAKVRTSPGSTSPLTRSKNAPTTASVTLRLVVPTISSEQATTIATLVSRGLGVLEENLTISDQKGNNLFEARGEEDFEEDVRELMARQVEHDARVTREANRVLEEILGPNKARVSVRSEWDHDRSTTRTEVPNGKGMLLSETRNTSETPIESQTDLAGAAGLDSNVASEFADAVSEQIKAEPPTAKTSEESKQYKPAVTMEERVRFTPTLTRLSVAVFLDDGLGQDLGSTLEQAIKAAVGFKAGRDEFSAVFVPFVGAQDGEGPLEDGETSPTTAADDAPPEPNTLLQTAIERGVEIVTALVFIGLLLKSLKGSKAASAATEGAGESDEIGPDPEMVARLHVEQLLESDPERVGEILASWVRSEEEQKTGAGV